MTESGGIDVHPAGENLTIRRTRVKSHAATVRKDPPEARLVPTPLEKCLPARSPSQTYAPIGKHPFSPEYHDRKGRLPPYTRATQATKFTRPIKTLAYDQYV